MKKTYKIRIILVFIALTMQFSCSNFLELVPPSGLIRADFWKTKEDVQSVLMGAYTSFASMNGDLFTYGEARGDMVTASQYWQGSDQYKLMQSNINPTNSFCDWSKFYKVINYCNEVIKNAPEVQKIDGTFNDFQLKGIMSEAYFLRSLSYFYLVRIFKDVPFLTEPSENDGVDFYPTQTKAEDILTAILKDLNDCRSSASDPSLKSLAEAKGRATKASIDALIAEISLWNFDYEACITACDRIISNTTYQMVPYSQWFSIFYPGNSLEGIFEFQFNDQLNQKNSTYGLTNQNANQYLPSKQAADLFGIDNGSLELVRGEKSSIAMLSKDNYMIWKYVGFAPDGRSVRPTTIQNSCNWIVYRLTDVYLMKAEALSQLNHFAEAAAILNMIRVRAQVEPLAIADSPTAYEDAVMNERCLELAFEGKRWFDLLRMGRRNNYARKAKFIETIISAIPSTQKRVLSAKLTNSMGWYLPVSKTESERNLNLVQNSYYIF
jgi:starch-binding outer membrane protein, SusD/RagB family